MEFDDLIKIVTRETYLFVSAFGLNENHSSRSDIFARVTETMGYTSKTILQEDYNCFSSSQLKSWLNSNLFPLVDGDEDRGYKIKDSEHSVLSKVNYAINFAVSRKLSLRYVFGDTKGALNVAKILLALKDRQPIRIQDICESSGISVSVPGKHLERLAEIGCITFEGYQPPRYHWNQDINSFKGVEEKVEESLQRYSSSFRTNRAIEVARRMFDNRSQEHNLSDVETLIEHRFKSGGSNRNLTAGALRNLQRLGYVIPSNDFSMGLKQSKVSAIYIEEKNPLIEFVQVMKQEDGPQLERLSPAMGVTLMDLYIENIVKKMSSEDRQKQILNYINKKGRSSLREMRKDLGYGGVHKYLKILEDKGEIRGIKVGSALFYSPLLPQLTN